MLKSLLATLALVAGQLLSTDPTLYKPEGYKGGKAYGGGQLVHYATVSLWVNALECADLAGDTNLVSALVNQFDPYRPGAKKSSVMNDFRHVDLSIIGAVPLEIAILTGDKELAKLGLSYADRQWEKPREGLDWGDRWYDPIPLERRLEMWQKGYTPETRLWIDDMYMITLLQSQAFRLTGDVKYIERSAKEMCLYIRELQRDDGLFNHGPDVPFVWGRGDGWMAAGMALNLKYLPKDSECREEIISGYRKMMATLLANQRESGLWGQLVNDPESYEETSGSAMFAYAFMAGVNAGVLNDEYRIAAEKAYNALLTKLDKYGNLGAVCVGTGKRNSREWYLTRPVCNGDPHGQAPLLWLIRELLAYYKSLQ